MYIFEVLGGSFISIFISPLFSLFFFLPGYLFLILCLTLSLLHQSSSSNLVQPVSCVRM